MIILDDFYTEGRQRLTQFIQMENRKSRMRLPGRPEIFLHADMQLLRSALEPAASSRVQDRWLLNFLQTQDRPIEISSRSLTTFRHGDLNVIDAGNA